MIAAKRDGRELREEEIAFLVRGYVQGHIPDYQMAALAMAIYFQGMTESETASLTLEMLNSGTRLRWPDDGIVRVDKHSTGGLGDKTSLILAPLLVECGLQVPMLSGRALGATGGTLDKLESISGFRTDLTLDEIRQQTLDVGCVITGASDDLAPADRKLYALRDVTATVPSIPLITASIMSKKLAESPGSLVLDVKFGTGAFMKTQAAASTLARALVHTGERMNVRTTALLTDMNQPLGRMCGNAVEVLEAIDVLKGGGPPDVRELTIALCTELLLGAHICSSEEAARALLARRLDDGSAYSRFEQLVIAQGGNLSHELRVAPAIDIHAASSGFVSMIETEELGLAIIAMGGGRTQLGQQIDHSVGLEMLVRIGDEVEAGQPVIRVFGNPNPAVKTMIEKAVLIGASASAADLIVEHIASS